MPTNYIDTRVGNGVFTITLNRPDKLNSFIEPMAGELQEALNTAKQDDTVRAVILTGSGRGFCAGQDLSEAIGNGENEEYELGDTVRKSYNPVIKGIRYLEKPVIAAINGTAAGAGANLAFACDIILAAEEAKFIQSFSKIGLIPDSGGTYLLPKLMGFHRALAHMMLAEPMSAAQAKEIGIVHQVTDADNLLDETHKLAEKLAKRPTRSFALIKKAVNQSFNNDLESQLELEAKLQTKAGQTEDYKEGVNAFLEKRKPKFKGK